jgi:CRP-like cAMP-binding protein
MSRGGQANLMTERSVEAMLARSPLFGVLEPAERLELADKMREVVLEAGQLLFSRGDPGDSIYLVMEGRIRISVLSIDGRELSFAHAETGDVFGEIAALDKCGRSADATAIACTTLKALPHSAYRNLLLARSDLALATIELLCRRLRDVSDHFEAVALHSVDVRLARLLLDRLSDTAEPRAAQRWSVTLDMSQTDLALLIGTTRQRANAALLSLEKAGAIRRAGRHIECDVRALRRIAQRE